jgi:hypothetical protein
VRCWEQQSSLTLPYRYWLHKCNSEHRETCGNPLDSSASGLGLPTWLIDVKKKCLVLADPTDPDFQYACLSYVWGGVDTIKLGVENCGDLLQKNSLMSRWFDIPKTIRDTIGLVEQLGIPFLWVDALCIVQDDAELKGIEIGSMAGIYASSYCTIIAGNGWDANHGLRGTQGVTDPRNLSTFTKNDVQENLQPFSSIWYSRGWTFQEMVFAPRKIMFQYQLAMWECKECSWHEMSLSKHPSPLSSFKPKINPPLLPFSLFSKSGLEQYVKYVTNYTNRRLTYGEDGLRAIFSLLSVLASSFSGGFISGLPVDAKTPTYFDAALLWYPTQWQVLQKRQNTEGTNTLPTWAWAAWEGDLAAKAWYDHFSLSMPTSMITWRFGDTMDDLRPVQENRTISSASYLFGRTQSRVFKAPEAFFTNGKFAYETRIYSQGKMVGQVRDDTGMSSKRAEAGGDIELALLSSGTYLSSHSTTNKLLDDDLQNSVGDDLDLLHALDWGAFYSGDGGLTEAEESKRYLVTEHHLRETPLNIQFYYVMWIGWNEGVAYRKGLGRFLKDAWDSGTHDEIDLLLG